MHTYKWPLWDSLVEFSLVPLPVLEWWILDYLKFNCCLNHLRVLPVTTISLVLACIWDNYVVKTMSPTILRTNEFFHFSVQPWSDKYCASLNGNWNQSHRKTMNTWHRTSYTLFCRCLCDFLHLWTKYQK